MPRVLVTTPMLIRQPGAYLDILQQGGFDVVYPPEGANLKDAAQLCRVLDGIDAVLAHIEPYNRDVIGRSKLRVIARSGVGYDAIDVAAATEAGIVVTITPGEVEKSVAEHTIALLLCLTRGLFERERQVRSGQWRPRALPRIAGKTMGLVGLGRCGREVAVRAIGLGMKMIATDPWADAAFAARHGIDLVLLDDLLCQADVVSLHLPSVPETARLIDAAALAKMKPGSILVNVARGAVVDQQALCDSLAAGHLFGAALDVFEVEPLPLDSRLLQLDNVVLCSHAGGLDEVSQTAMSTTAAQCIVDLHAGRWPEPCVVNRQLGRNWAW
jgi:D-3-phosphoglycerate dehydrogenase / 2-oxoglutarate reductase